MADRSLSPTRSSPNLSGGGKHHSSGGNTGAQEGVRSTPISPSRFRTPASPSPIAAPTVYKRQCNRWHSDLEKQKLQMKADLGKMIEEWDAEMDKLEKALGDQGLQTLLNHLAKINPKQERELRAYADELTGVLATAKVLRQLHQPVKMVQNWDALSRELLEALNSRQTSVNVITLRKQALLTCFASSAFALARVATFSCFLAGIVGTTGASLGLAAASIFPAGLQSAVAVRNHYQLQEKYYQNRAEAFASMGRALRALEDFPAHTVDDALGMLAFRDACSRLPEFSPTAALDAQTAGIARMRDQGVTPVNILISCLGQILAMTQAPQWSSSLSLGLSSIAYDGQAILNGLQGRAQYEKTSSLSARYRAWLGSKAQCGRMRDWAGRNDMNHAAQIGAQAHMHRSLGQQRPEMTGAVARLIKSPLDGVNALMAGAASALPWFDLAPAGFSAMAGLLASSISAIERAVTGVVVWKRGAVPLEARERQRQARLMLALNDPRDLLDRINRQDGGSLTLSVPGGVYDERKGFAFTSLSVRPDENEFIALEALADAVDAFADGVSGADDPLAELLMEVFGMNPLDWINLLRVLNGMRNGAERNAFIKQRLASVIKVDFKLGADGLEAPLPAEVVVHRFLLELADEELDLKQIFASPPSGGEETQWGAALRDKFKPLLNDIGEDAFLAAFEEVWAQRITCAEESVPRLKLYALQVLSTHLLSRRQRFIHAFLYQLESDKHALIRRRRHRYPENDVNVFVEVLSTLLKAAPAERSQRRTATYHLARMRLTQELLFKPQRFRELACYQDLMQVLGLVDRVVEPDTDPDNELVYSVDGSSESSFPDSDRVTTTSSNPSSDSERPDLAAESLRSPAVEPTVAQDRAPSEEPGSPGLKLLSLMKTPLAKRRSARPSAVLQAVVTQLPLAVPALPESNSSRVLYTQVQPPGTPLATPRN